MVNELEVPLQETLKYPVIGPVGTLDPSGKGFGHGGAARGSELFGHDSVPPEQAARKVVVYVYTDICIYVCVCVYVYGICMRIYIYTYL